ncbi:MAG: oligosaccharide flippase family protein [Candidatus Gastranaerophilales bacterium]|nr:oligosaccharide flippase family protein [Candidatus Gastranaerophilales bacterium]
MITIDKIKKISSDKKALFHNFTAMGIIQLLNYVLPFITLPYLSRVLSIDKFGLIFFAQAIMDYFVRFTDYGFNQSAVRELAQKRDNQIEIQKIFCSVFSAKCFLLLISFIVLSTFIFLFDKFRNDWLLYYFTFLSVVGNVCLSAWFFQGMERMKFITLFNVITRIISLICIFTFVKQPSNYILVPLFNSLGILVASVFALITVKTRFNVSFISPTMKEIIEKLKNSSEYFLSSISIGLYQSSNAFVLGLCTTTTMVAYYVSAQKFYLAIYFMYYPFYNAFFPYMTKNKDIKFFRKVFKTLVCFSLVLTIFIFVFSKYIITIFYGQQMIEAYKCLRIFAFIIPFHILADIMSFPLLGAFGYTKETNQCWVIGGIFHILGIFALYLINHINIYTISSLFTITYFFMFLHRVYYVWKFRLLSGGIL